MAPEYQCVSKDCPYLFRFTNHGEKIPLCTNPEDVRFRSKRTIEVPGSYVDGMYRCLNRNYRYFDFDTGKII